MSGWKTIDEILDSNVDIEPGLASGRLGPVCPRRHLFGGPVADSDQNIARLLADLPPGQVYRVLKQYGMADHDDVRLALRRIHNVNRVLIHAAVPPSEP